ncbi:M10 family metallopeptidase C-terminal domain-containing protein [Ancylobacter sonchi]|uniref:M10 family metallopeptidase C-terminal domain-containing protein n=1 Tax=Ancylobacter sonchi TaxID=1937790 RepID=UPI001BD40C2C|nr:M10 family metallopeptidase C-terminal domain-containing protein [Ancylobacter sonchi]MBS7536928.1 M10 family metallopeptidase C-terminal domain-containing protein [Ancylobacter sonchi]
MQWRATGRQQQRLDESAPFKLRFTEDDDMAQPWDLLHSWSSDRIESLNRIIATADGQMLDGTPAGDWMRSDEYDDVTLNGSDGDDAITADGGNRGEFNAGAGNDYLSAGRVGSDFEDYPQNTGGVFNGGDGDDLFDGNEGSNVTFNGGDGGDVFTTSLATDSTFNGDAGDDFFFLDGLESGDSTNTYNGGTGIDTAMLEDLFDTYDFKRIGQTLTIIKEYSTATVTNIEYFRFQGPGPGEYTELTLDQLAMDRVATIDATGDDYVDGLLQGSKWISPVTYTLPRVWYSGFDLTKGMPAALIRIYSQVENIMQLNINEKWEYRDDDEGEHYPARDADIHIYFLEGGHSAPAVVQGPDEGGNADIYPNDPLFRQRAVAGNETYLVALQIVAQSLGLKFAGETGRVADVAVPADKDSLEYTVLSQRSYPGGPAGDYTVAANNFPQTLMTLDVQALQTLYGADYSYNRSDNVYRWNATTGWMSIDGALQNAPAGNTIFLTIWDGGGNDTYDFSNYTDAMSIDLSPGGASLFSQALRASLGDGVMARGNVYNAYLYNDNPASLIENAIGGSGNDTLRGNVAANALNGNAGADTMSGLAGDDSYVVDNLGDVVVEAAGEGTDLVYVRVSGYVLPANVENARAENGRGDIEIRGNELGNVLAGNLDGNALYGNAGADTLYGSVGNDHLDGGTGPDAMVGGSGDDTYIVDNYSDVVYEKPNQGTDTLWTSVSRGLDNDFENIVLFGAATDAGGNSKNNIVSGNQRGNNLYGGGGSDSLYGKAGSDRLFGEDGNDYMTGGTGRDAYYGGAGYDYAIIEKGGGVDYFVDWKVSEDRVAFDSDLFPSIGAVLTAAFQNGTDVVIWDGHDGIVLQNAQLTQLTTSNFLFV